MTSLPVVLPWLVERSGEIQSAAPAVVPAEVRLLAALRALSSGRYEPLPELVPLFTANEDALLFEVRGTEMSGLVFSEAVDLGWGNHGLSCPEGGVVWRPTDGGVEGLSGGPVGASLLAIARSVALVRDVVAPTVPVEILEYAVTFGGPGSGPRPGYRRPTAAEDWRATPVAKLLDERGWKPTVKEGIVVGFSNEDVVVRMADETGLKSVPLREQVVEAYSQVDPLMGEALRNKDGSPRQVQVLAAEFVALPGVKSETVLGAFDPVFQEIYLAAGTDDNPRPVDGLAHTMAHEGTHAVLDKPREIGDPEWMKLSSASQDAYRQVASRSEAFKRDGLPAQAASDPLKVEAVHSWGYSSSFIAGSSLLGGQRADLGEEEFLCDAMGYYATRPEILRETSGMTRGAVPVGFWNDLATFVSGEPQSAVEAPARQPVAASSAVFAVDGTLNGVVALEGQPWWEAAEAAGLWPPASAEMSVYGGPGSGPRPGYKRPKKVDEQPRVDAPSLADISAIKPRDPHGFKDPELAAAAEAMIGPGTFGDGFTVSVTDASQAKVYQPDGSWKFAPGIKFGGEILNKDGESVGVITRQIQQDADGKWVAHHDFMSLRKEERGKGFATDFNNRMESYYKDQGVDRIELEAGGPDGLAVWAKAGYDWDFKAMSSGRPREVDLDRPWQAPGGAHGFDYQALARQLPDRELGKRLVDNWGTPDAPTPYEIVTSPGGEAALRGGESWFGVRHLVTDEPSAIAASASDPGWNDRFRRLAEIAAAWDHEGEEEASLAPDPVDVPTTPPSTSVQKRIAAYRSTLS